MRALDAESDCRPQACEQLHLERVQMTLKSALLKPDVTVYFKYEAYTRYRVDPGTRFYNEYSMNILGPSLPMGPPTITCSELVITPLCTAYSIDNKVICQLCYLFLIQRITGTE